MSGGLPIICPVCAGKSRRDSSRPIEPSDDATGSIMQYRRCTNPSTPNCPHKTESFKAIIGWSSSSPYPSATSGIDSA